MGQISSIAHQTCVALTNARLYEEIKENHLRTIKALAIAVDAKDKYTRGHSENVMKYSLATTEEMGILDQKINDDIQNAALLHDIGKIGIPGHILNKPGMLSPEEFNGVMKGHVKVGANIIREIPFLKDLVPLVLHHHERYDGKGYPDGLRGEDIPVGARILSVADSFEAMTSDRPYRKALSLKTASHQLIISKGTQFDPYIVDFFIAMLKKKFPDTEITGPETENTQRRDHDN
jgi:putative nucleotidyltransferase with HDIG domain